MKQVFQSSLNQIFFSLRKRLRYSRKGYKETPWGQIKDVDADTINRIHFLKKRYKVGFEAQFQKLVCLDNYHYLDLFDRFFSATEKPKSVSSLLDVGSKNFYYAIVLKKFFQPRELMGLEIDAYKIYEDFHSRYDYAQYYISFVGSCEYKVTDFIKYKGNQADLLTLFYPFVTPEPLVNWTLPLSTFKPNKIFEKANTQITKQGNLLMINKGGDEFEIAKAFAENSGFKLCHHQYFNKTLIFCDESPVMSLWQKEISNE